MNVIFFDKFYRRYIFELFKNLCQLWVLRICFSQFFQDTFYTWNAHLGTRMVELIKRSFKKKQVTEAVFHLNNRLHALLNLKKIEHFYIRFN